MSLEDDIITIKSDLATLIAAPASDLTPVTTAIAALQTTANAILAQFTATPPAAAPSTESTPATDASAPTA